jgi:hypothetical protein
MSVEHSSIDPNIVRMRQHELHIQKILKRHDSSSDRLSLIRKELQNENFPKGPISLSVRNAKKDISVVRAKIKILTSAQKVEDFISVYRQIATVAQNYY